MISFQTMNELSSFHPNLPCVIDFNSTHLFFSVNRCSGITKAQDKMAEAKLTTRKGEVFTFSDNNHASANFSSVLIKDIIVSVKKLQENVNNKLTEIVNEDKMRTGQNVNKESEMGK